jgi:hypothetical protein
MPDETPSTSEPAPDGAAPDPTDGPNFGVPDVDWGALKADMIIAANRLGDHLSVLKVSRRFSDAASPSRTSPGRRRRRPPECHL